MTAAITLPARTDSAVVESVVTFMTEAPWRVTVRIGGVERAAADGVDLYQALWRTREALESEGILLCCEGARLDVRPSGMTRQARGGRYAYRVPPDRPPQRDDLVDIFAPTDCADVTTTGEQKALLDRLLGR